MQQYGRLKFICHVIKKLKTLSNVPLFYIEVPYACEVIKRMRLEAYQDSTDPPDVTIWNNSGIWKKQNLSFTSRGTALKKLRIF